jgi:hypothetical protein
MANFAVRSLMKEGNMFSRTLLSLYSILCVSGVSFVCPLCLWSSACALCLSSLRTTVLPAVSKKRRAISAECGIGEYLRRLLPKPQIMWNIKVNLAPKTENHVGHKSESCWPNIKTKYPLLCTICVRDWPQSLGSALSIYYLASNRTVDYTSIVERPT